MALLDLGSINKTQTGFGLKADGATVVQPKVLPAASKFASKAMVRRASARGSARPTTEDQVAANEKYKIEQPTKPKKTFEA